MLIQLHLPEIAQVLVNLAIAGNVSACALCLRIGDPAFSFRHAFTHYLRRASPDDIAEIIAVLDRA